MPSVSATLKGMVNVGHAGMRSRPRTTCVRTAIARSARGNRAISARQSQADRSLGGLAAVAWKIVVSEPSRAEAIMAAASHSPRRNVASAIPTSSPLYPYKPFCMPAAPSPSSIAVVVAPSRPTTPATAG